MHAKSISTLVTLVLGLLFTESLFGQSTTDTPERDLSVELDLIQTPTVHWEYQREDERREGKTVGLSSPYVFAKQVFVGDDKGRLCAFNSATGKENWSYEHGARIFHEPSCNGKVVCITSEIGLDLVNVSDGKLAWRKELDEGNVGQCMIWPPVAPDSGKLSTAFYATDNGKIQAVDTTRGLKKWESSLMENLLPDPPGFDGDRARFDGRPCRPSGIATDGELVIQSMFDQCRLVAFTARTGKEVWSFPTEGWTYCSATIDGDEVFVASQSRKLFCIDKESGEKIWEFQAGGRIESSPALTEDRVFIPACDGNLYCLERASGKIVWMYRAGQTAIYCKPLLTNDAIYFAAGHGFVHAVNPDNGNQIWKFRAMESSDLYSELATDGKLLFVTSRPELRDGKWIGTDALIAIGDSD